MLYAVHGGCVVLTLLEELYCVHKADIQNVRNVRDGRLVRAVRTKLWVSEV
jgi:hypothetical protein